MTLDEILNEIAKLHHKDVLVIYERLKYQVNAYTPHLNKLMNEFKDLGVVPNLYKNGESQWIILARVGNFLIRRIINGERVCRPELFEDYDACKDSDVISRERRTSVEYLTGTKSSGKTVYRHVLAPYLETQRPVVTLDTVKEILSYYDDLSSKIEYGKSLAKQFNINVKQIDGYMCLMSCDNLCRMKPDAMRSGIILADGQWQLLTKNTTWGSAYNNSYIDIEIPDRIPQSIDVTTLNNIAKNCDIYRFSDDEVNDPNSHVVMVVNKVGCKHLVIDPKNNKLGRCFDININWKLIDFVSDKYANASGLKYCIVWRDCPPEIMKKVTSKAQKKFNQ